MRLGKVKSYSQDFFLNIIATFLSTGTMQLVVLPQLSRNISSEDYGVMLTATGFMNILINAFGNNLCNSRLRQDGKYKSKGVVGDYQIMLMVTACLALTCICVFNVFLKEDVYSLVLPLALITMTGICKAYYLVTYRLSINYKRNLIANAFSCVGYCFGGLILIKYCKWPWVFLPADILTLAYIAYSSKIISEPFQKTELFNDSARVTLALLIGGLIGNVTTYLDRFIIYPTLGSRSVSTYATAAWFSKSILIVMAPITSVLLSYITAGRLRLNRKKYNYICLLLLVGMFVFWGGSIVVAPCITGWMYPTLIEQARPYITFVSLSVTMGIMGNFLAVMVLAYAPVAWQTIIPIIKVLIYMILGVLMVKQYGIMGMVIAVFIANLVCNVISYFLARKWVREELV
ncbi:MAG: oligosaccharide flippase family protein [Paludibacteraceae bacterium]|nr:oligosaccharide flippase family protein [Paludibacteraceae bacterium]